MEMMTHSTRLPTPNLPQSISSKRLDDQIPTDEFRETIRRLPQSTLNERFEAGMRRDLNRIVSRIGEYTTCTNEAKRLLRKIAKDL